MSGTRIIEVLEQAVENTFTGDPATKVGGMVQVSGIRFRYDPKMAKGHRVWHVERTEGKWKPMDEYTLATNTMMAGGGHNYRTCHRAVQIPPLVGGMGQPGLMIVGISTIGKR